MQSVDEYHVASFVAQVVPAAIDQVCEKIAALPGGEVHIQSHQGKLVFTLEASSDKQIAQQMDLLKDIAGVLSLAPVYHQYTSE
ncbi:chaperone NapD [Thalassotalea mangrovi]|uniref:Chaperone NapD n=1 Tax=Thalassotalea mangrovi TaxID=2572245 RepID=A0A4U1B9L6_9GAMM|nr:chaperone NapD [Thalassotalea mangrovi]TKB47401.1 sorbose reductase [Thalassotalea mangrovi]